MVNIIRRGWRRRSSWCGTGWTARGLARESGNRVVLTGGASQLSGAREMASRILDRQVRLGKPIHLRGLPDSANGPAFATGRVC